MMFQPICISAEYLDDRFQMFFHNRYSDETTPAAGAAGWYEMCWFGIVNVPLMELLATFHSGDESLFRDWLMYVDLLGTRVLQDVPGMLDFNGAAVGNQ